MIERVVLPLLLVLALLVSITIGCIRVTEKPIESGQFTTYDLDEDGQDDMYAYKFATEEVANDVFLDRTLEYNKSDDGYQGKIILRFDDRSKGKTHYVHIEEIPKEFASHVDELEFSVPPDEIIEPDPKVKWNYLAENLVFFTKEYTESRPETIVENMALIAIQYERQTKDFEAEEKGPELDKEILQRASQYKGMLRNPEIGTSPAQHALCQNCSQPYAKAACLAILSGDPQKWCTSTSWAQLDKESDIDMCKGIYIQYECEDIADKAARDKCYFTKAIELNCEIACLQVTDSDNQKLCLAGVKNDSNYCEQIKDPETKNKCLQALGMAPETIQGTEIDLSQWDRCDFGISYEAHLKNLDPDDPASSTLERHESAGNFVWGNFSGTTFSGKSELSNVRDDTFTVTLSEDGQSIKTATVAWTYYRGPYDWKKCKFVVHDIPLDPEHSYLESSGGQPILMYQAKGAEMAKCIGTFEVEFQEVGSHWVVEKKEYLPESFIHFTFNQPF